MKELLEEGGEGLTGLARALLEAGINEMMSAQADAACEVTGTTVFSQVVPSRFLRTFRQPPRPALQCGYPSSSVTSR